MRAARVDGTATAGFGVRFPAWGLAAALLAGSLAGCSSPPPELDRDTAKQLQSQVLAVSEAAAAKDPAGCLKLLDELQARLDAAATSGQVSFKRHQGIKSSIDAVRADLAAQKAAAETARVAAEKAAAEKAAAQAAAQAAAKAAAAKAAAPAPAAPAVVIPAPAKASAAGKAKGKDKGKGKGKG
ncbi:mucin-associated surface protein [Arthrobacter sp. NPDC058192]|uniref:mucin-associated surface protein n=1 Tax=Arthrobacter sp. NPDC058192 TaxID=3346372 RepID=UPI0036E624B6